MADLPPLPQGVSLDTQAPTQLPPLPGGVKLDTPESNWMADLKKYGPGFLKESGQKMLASFLRAPGDLAHAVQDRPAGYESPRPQTFLDDLANKVDVPDVDPSLTYNKVIRGVGQAALTPVLGAESVPVNIARNVAPVVVGTTTGDILGNAVPAKYKQAAEIGGNMVGGGLTGFALGAKQSPARADIRDVFQGTEPDAFIAAQDRARQVAATAGPNGATTATAAEMFPPDHPVQGLAAGARNGPAGNPLALQTTGREADLQRLGALYQNRLGGDIFTDPAAIANQTQNSAAQIISEMKGSNTAETGRQFSEASPFQQRDVFGVYSDLHSLADPGVTQSPSLRRAYSDVADALTNGLPVGDPRATVITNPQTISIELRRLREDAQNPLSRGPVGSGAYSAHDMQTALSAAENRLRLAGPAGTRYGEILDDHGQFARDMVDPTQRGPVGVMAGANNTAGATPVARLAQVFGGANSPETVGQTAREVNSPFLTGGAPTSPLDIAQALAAMKLRQGTGSDVGRTIRGEPGSMADQQNRALIQAGGGDAAHINQPLEVADMLQGNKNAPQVNTDPKMQPLQYLIRPFRTMDMAMTGKMASNTSRETAQLLANPTPENIRELQRIAMFDPRLRALLTTKSAVVNPMLQQEQQ